MVTFSQVVNAVNWLNTWCPRATYSVRIEDDGEVYFRISTWNKQPNFRNRNATDYLVTDNDPIEKYIRDSVLSVGLVVGLDGQEEVRKLLGLGGI